MTSENKVIKGYVKTENMILIVVLALGLGFIGGVVFSVYRSTGTVPVAGNNIAQPSATQEQQQMLSSLIEHTKKNPNDVEAWTQLGHLYFDTGQADKAIHAYEKSLALDGNRPDVMTDLGVMYRRNGDPKKAVEAFDRALLIKPDHQIALYNKGIVLMHDLKDPQGAIEAWEQLLKMNPDAKTPAGESLKNIIEQLKKNLAAQPQ